MPVNPSKGDQWSASGARRVHRVATRIRVKTSTYELRTIAVESSDTFCPHAPQLKLGVPVYILLP